MAVPPVLLFCCGAECGNALANTAPPATLTSHWASVTGVTIETTIVRRTGTKSYKFGGTNPTFLHTFVTALASPATLVTRFYVYFNVLPGANTPLFGATTTGGGTPEIRFILASNTIQASLSNGGILGGTGFVVTTGQWYCIDVRIINGTTATVEAQVNGVAVGTASASTTAGNCSGFIFKQFAGGTSDIYFDDIAISGTGGDYPIGPGQVDGIKPSSDGTHSFTLNDFLYNAAGAAIATNATDVWTFLDDPIDNISDFINMALVTTGYVEVILGSGLRAIVARINGVEVVWGHHSAAATSNTGEIRLNDGGSVSTISGLIDMSETTLVSPSKHFATPPSGGAWTAQKVNALRVRWGFSSDANPDVYLDALVAEVDYATVAPANRQLILQAVQRSAVR